MSNNVGLLTARYVTRSTTLLCRQRPGQGNDTKPVEEKLSEPTQSCFTNYNSTSCETLLPTAIILISDNKNRLIKARVVKVAHI